MEADDKYRFVAGVVVVRNPTVSLKVNNTEDDIHSPYRQPNKKLYLCVKKPRNDHAWQFPQGGIKKKESIQQGALRELKEECGEDIKVELMDRSHPVCIYQYDFPAEFLKRSKRKYIGAKVGFAPHEHRRDI
ncbi:hypothetical protein BDB01DRAFT_719585 [Pilobolus umbonatus]|nr:hypothetical protein BDB01DRAFT_719585 [Pilobolus umbonatus]